MIVPQPCSVNLFEFAAFDQRLYPFEFVKKLLRGFDEG